jgi:hypothetical protein
MMLIPDSQASYCRLGDRGCGGFCGWLELGSTVGSVLLVAGFQPGGSTGKVLKMWNSGTIA